ncbi:hypothetical protein O6H91_09G052600 [Diphasiastrum complanatum]|uniref:Uncharacterized protein n=1 Tax=Diphasiastrum complanatum TaxID=34168 RepID=A0ACC2CP52_DIPCM|nr:hypothetical protein O6H91_09G052600 [Diphasiastrum complanatum]
MGCGPSHVDVNEAGASNAAAAMADENKPEPGASNGASANADFNKFKGTSKKKVSERLIIFVLGGPGCGKSTQCRQIVEKFNFVHISVGDLLRSEVAKGSPLGIECEKLMKEGKLVHVDVSLKLIMSAMDNSRNKHFLIDGFPRAVDQAQAFEAKIARPNMLIYLDCPIEIMEDRLLRRGETSGRTDDNAETFKKRFNNFIRDTVPVLAYYEKTSPKLVKKVSSVPPPAEVFMEISILFKEALKLEEKTTVRTFDHNQHDCKRKTFIFVLGGPGSGKGTQCELIVRDFGYTHLSTGDLLRNEIKSGSEIGKSCEYIVKEGKLVPLEITMKLLQDAMDKVSCKHFLIDGFPRAVEQAYEFESKVGKPDIVIYLNCSMEIMEKRLLERGKSSGRADDNIDTIKKRFEAFVAESKPVVKYYAHSAPDAIKEVSADKPIDEVYKEIKAILESKEQTATC